MLKKTLITIAVLGIIALIIAYYVFGYVYSAAKNFIKSFFPPKSYGRGAGIPVHTCPDTHEKMVHCVTKNVNLVIKE